MLLRLPVMDCLLMSVWMLISEMRGNAGSHSPSKIANLTSLHQRQSTSALWMAQNGSSITRVFSLEGLSTTPSFIFCSRFPLHGHRCTALLTVFLALPIGLLHFSNPYLICLAKLFVFFYYSFFCDPLLILVLFLMNGNIPMLV